jgi:hypothetical protein
MAQRAHPARTRQAQDEHPVALDSERWLVAIAVSDLSGATADVGIKDAALPSPGGNYISTKHRQPTCTREMILW